MYANKYLIVDNLTFHINLANVTKLEVERANAGSMLHGGSWRPCDCKPSSKIAIIIPFRDRHQQLYIFLNNIIPYLQYQRRKFRIFVVEQVCACVRRIWLIIRKK